MPIFSYKASTRKGELLEGAIEAADERAAIDRLKNSGIIPISIRTSEKPKRRRISLSSSKDDLLIFTGELSALLGAGLPLDRSLTVLAEISESKWMKETVESVQKSVREGSSLSEALKKHPKTFPGLYVNMVSAGETGGVLDLVLPRLNDLLDSAKELKEYIFSAMIYPIILIITSGISIIFLLTYVIPKFSVIFDELGGLLPLPTRILLAVSNAFQSTWWIILIISISAWVLLRRSIKSDAGRFRWDAFKIKMTGDLITKIETARFCRTLGILLKSGVPMIEALNSSRDVVSNSVISTAIEKVTKDIREGKGIAGPLSQSEVFPPLALSMIQVGEESGQLENMLSRVASTYEKSLKLAIKRAMSILEPAMILGTGLIVGFIAVSVFLAVFSIIDIPF